MAVTEHDVREAEERMAELRRNGFARSARYDAESDRLVIDLSTGIQVAFPPRLAEGLADASANDLAVIEISASGLGLHWPALDADLYVPALLQGVLGSKRWMAAELAAAGGRSHSAVEAGTARENGRKGGRPPKAVVS